MTRLKGIEGGAGKEPDEEPSKPWEDPNFFGQPKDGDTVPVGFRMPQSMARELAVVVQSGKLPSIQTNSDAFRDAIWRWLRVMAERIGDRDMALALDVEKAAANMDHFIKKAEKTRTTITNAKRILESPEIDSVVRAAVLKNLCDIVQKSPLDSPFRKEIITLVAQYR